MSNLEYFDFDKLKNMTLGSLIDKYKELIEKFSSYNDLIKINTTDIANKFAELKMSNSEHLDQLKNMTFDTLIDKCKELIEKHLSLNDSIEFDKAYQDDNFDKAKTLLEKTFENVENEERRDNIMGRSKKMSEPLIITVAIFVFAALGTALYLKNSNKTLGDLLPFGSSSNKEQSGKIEYTKKDKAMIELIHELSGIYRNIDK